MRRGRGRRWSPGGGRPPTFGWGSSIPPDGRVRQGRGFGKPKGEAARPRGRSEGTGNAHRVSGGTAHRRAAGHRDSLRWQPHHRARSDGRRIERPESRRRGDRHDATRIGALVGEKHRRDAASRAASLSRPRTSQPIDAPRGARMPAQPKTARAGTERASPSVVVPLGALVPLPLSATQSERFALLIEVASLEIE